MERRALQVELRAAGGNPRKLAGYVATFDSEARIGDFVETIKPGAFKASLASGADIVALVDHDPTRLLARMRNATLSLYEDVRGLAFTIDLPDTTLGRDIAALAERGDLGGMSFGFKAVDEFWNGNRRELRAVELREISIVQSWPAYSDTVVEARSKRASTWLAQHRWR
jgi:HK97 family phage prohead protease